MTTSSSSVLTALANTLGQDVVSKIQSSKILLVGSGGIGCELIKNLTLSGFRHVVTIDMDTIDVSNLNRQLLFRSQHVGKSKCEVACQVAVEMIGEETAAEGLQPISYKAEHGNVCDNTRFNLHFVKQFDLVLNALDNVTARRRVNRLCLAAEVPLVEAGTTGYLGQVNVMDKTSGVACYECTTQETQKVYPICTIRSTPSQPVHTIVWAKELYKLLFHEKMDQSMLYEDPNGEEPSTYMKSVQEVRDVLKDSSRSKDDVNSATEAMFKALFVDEIQKQLDMGRYKGAKKTPSVLGDDIIQEGKAAKEAPSASKATDQLWTPAECVAEAMACLQEAHEADSNTLLQEFDKDDDLAMRWVCSASNLRSHVFQIEPLQSLYSAKGIAGNIIPAIATTNAIVAGLQMIQVINILKSQMASGKKGGDLQEKCQYINCIRQSTRNGLYLTASKLNPPNPKCFVCRQATIPLTIGVNDWTLQNFLARIVKTELGFEEPILMLDGDIIWEEGQDADEEAFKVNLAKTLSKLPCGGIQHGTVMEIEDFSQDLKVNVAVTHQELWEGEKYDNPEQRFIVGGEACKPVPKKAPEAAAAKPAADAKPAAAAEDSDSDIEAWDVDTDGKPAAAKKKRAADDDKEEEPKAKRAKTEDGNGAAAKTTGMEVEIIELD